MVLNQDFRYFLKVRTDMYMLAKLCLDSREQMFQLLGFHFLNNSIHFNDSIYKDKKNNGNRKILNSENCISDMKLFFSKNLINFVPKLTKIQAIR